MYYSVDIIQPQMVVSLFLAYTGHVVSHSVLSLLPENGTMGSNWGEVRVTELPYHLIFYMNLFPEIDVFGLSG